MIVYHNNRCTKSREVVNLLKEKAVKFEIRNYMEFRLSKNELAARKRKWKARKSDFGSGTLWKYAQTVGPAYLGAPTHPGKKKEVKDYSEI